MQNHRVNQHVLKQVSNRITHNSQSAASLLQYKPRQPASPSLQPTPRLQHPSPPTSARSSHLSFEALHTSRSLNMASDEDYMAFLNKANEDVSGGSAQTAQQSGSSKFKAVDTGAEVPAAIQRATKDAFYMSDADEPFEGVSLKWSGQGGLPDEVEFAKLIEHSQPDKAEISIMDPMDWDSKGQYTKLLDAVREAGKGNDVRVYKVVRDKTRVEYYMITNADGHIVGVKALAVES